MGESADVRHRKSLQAGPHPSAALFRQEEVEVVCRWQGIKHAEFSARHSAAGRGALQDLGKGATLAKANGEGRRECVPGSKRIHRVNGEGRLAQRRGAALVSPGAIRP
jgi:hypothetical protein